MLIIGIDPGRTGALAAIKQGVLLDILDMPTHNKAAQYADAKRIRSWVSWHKQTSEPVTVIAEKVWAMNNQAGQTKFVSLAATGIAAALELADEFHEVTPREWQKHYGLIKKDKGAARQLAAETFPYAEHFFKRAKDDGRADAALIANYPLDKLPR